jgi:hypothetical protein
MPVCRGADGRKSNAVPVCGLNLSLFSKSKWLIMSWNDNLKKILQE